MTLDWNKWVGNELQTYLRDIAGLVPDHCKKAQYCNRASLNIFAGKVSYLQFIKNATPVKHREAKLNKMRYVCILFVFINLSYIFVSLTFISMF